MEKEIFDERSVELHLAKHLMPLVNAALVHANGLLRRPADDQTHLWGGGRTATKNERGRPDWSLCSRSKLTLSGKYLNLVPGDTKLSNKWRPSMPRENGEWELPIRQVQSYGCSLKVRYGFIITDAHLVVLRFRRSQIEPGIAQSRARRAVSARHTGAPDPSVPSTNTQARASSPASGNSPPNTGTSPSPPPPEDPTYSDTDPTTEFARPEYCAIPWSDYNMTPQGKPANKSPKLTIRLALFYLCLLARYSPDTSIGHEYPPLNSWTKKGAGYVHNSTGATATQPPANATVIEPPQQVPQSSSTTRPEGTTSASRSNSATRTQSSDQVTAATGTERNTVRTRSGVRFANETMGPSGGATAHAPLADRSQGGGTSGSGAHSSTARSSSPGVSALSGHGTTARSSSPGASATLSGHGKGRKGGKGE
jgi:hypothetical protein